MNSLIMFICGFISCISILCVINGIRGLLTYNTEKEFSSDDILRAYFDGLSKHVVDNNEDKEE